MTEILYGVTYIALHTALVVTVLVALLFKPDRVLSPRAFWWGCVCLAVATIFPLVIHAALMLMPRMYGSTTFAGVLKSMAFLASPVFSYAAFLCIVYSLGATPPGSH